MEEIIVRAAGSGLKRIEPDFALLRALHFYRYRTRAGDVMPIANTPTPVKLRGGTGVTSVASKQSVLNHATLVGCPGSGHHQHLAAADRFGAVQFAIRNISRRPAQRQRESHLRGSVGRLRRTFVNAIAVDRRGNAYAAGSTCSTDFPTTPEAFQHQAPGPGPNLLEPCDAFVVKLDRTGSHLLYATYLGGSGADSATSIWLDAEGNAYVAGYTSSADFPVTQDAAQHRFGGAIDGFLVMLDSEGRWLRYGTFLGGHDRDEVAALVGDSKGNLYVTGATRSIDFPNLERRRKASSAWDTFLLKMATGAKRLSGLERQKLSTASTGTDVEFGRQMRFGADAPQPVVLDIRQTVEAPAASCF
ncbi:MAG: hypothetical protein DMG57_07735 [Acidobacteria bacterium]|nr:MAG: hypothetical protein DMG57_07735 [Acidobacteriota bacterium]